MHIIQGKVYLSVRFRVPGKYIFLLSLRFPKKNGDYVLSSVVRPSGRPSVRRTVRRASKPYNSS